MVVNLSVVLLHRHEVRVMPPAIYWSGLPVAQRGQCRGTHTILSDLLARKTSSCETKQDRNGFVDRPRMTGGC